MDTTTTLCSIFNSGKSTEEICQEIKPYLDSSEILSWFQFVALYCLKNRVGNVGTAKTILECLDKLVLKPFRGTMTLTFGEVAESHVGMEKIGKMDAKGFTYDELVRAQAYFESKGCETMLVHLNDYLPQGEPKDVIEKSQLKKAREHPSYQAWILVARNGIKCLTGDDKGKNILTEMLLFRWDTKLYNERRGIVQNKLARHNLNFSDTKQVADFEQGKGTTIPWREVPILSGIKSKLINAFGDSAKTLKCEGNMYYAPGKTGIGYHGDTERRKVIGLRLGRSMSIHYNWYYNNSPRGKNVSILLNEGDIYCMSEKTVGTDWLSAPKKQYTLRHAAGAEKYTTKTDKLRVVNRVKEGEITVGDIQYRKKGGEWQNV